MLSRVLLPPVWAAIAAVAMWAVDRIAPLLRLGTAELDWAWLPPVAIGLGLVVWAERRFRSAGTSVLPWRNPSAFVADGPYRFTRNPMYLGLACCLLGWALNLGSVAAVLVIPLFLWIIQVRFVRPEERRLEDHFGESYRAYKARVRRWI